MAFKIITCPWCGKEARVTYEENRVYQMKCYSCRNSMLHEDRSFDRAVEFFEHHVNLLQAEQAGRLVVLPCKVGDTVYFTLLGRIIEKPVFSIVSFSASARIYCAGTSEYFRPEDFGKTVFLTREEAEAALKGGDG